MTASEIGAIFRARGMRAAEGGWFARHPEWWMLAISAALWIVLAATASHAILPRLCLASAGPIAASVAALRAAEVSSRLGWDFLGWMVMTAAMMPPLVILPVRHVAFRSFRDRRHRAIAGFLAGYLAVWTLAGAVLLPAAIAAAARGATERPVILAIGYLMAALWQLTPWKRGALRRCHRTVALAPRGWRADAACLGFGLRSGGSCLASCWVLMTAPMLASHSLAALAGIQAVMLCERYRRVPRPRTSTSLLLLGAAFLFDLRGGL